MRIVNLGAIIRGFRDTFVRDSTESQPLERSSTGSLWDIIRGTWTVSSNKLYTSTSASQYPITVTDALSASVNISIKDISQGTTAALWVTDGGNWWGLGIDKEVDNNCNCQNCTGSNYNSETVACGSYTYYVANYYYCCNVVGNRYCIKTGGNCRTTNAGKCDSWYAINNCGAYNSGNCNENPPYCIGGYSAVTNTNYCGPGNIVTGSYTYTCNCVTCYPQYVRVIQSVANTVSTVFSSMLDQNKVIRSLKLFIRGSRVDGSFYENTDLTSQIGPDLTFNPTGVSLTTRYGIAIKPSSYNQGNSNGEIDIEVV